MKSKSILIFIIFFCLLICSSSFGLCGESTLLNLFYKNGYRTHLGSVDGRLAGEEIYVQRFSGLTSTSLQPVGDSLGHLNDTDGNPTGLFLLPLLIPNVPLDTPGFVQVAAWDSTIWGRDFSQVPESQLGYSEVVPFPPDRGGPGPPPLVLLTKSIIVPSIPEPSTWTLLAMGGLLMTTVNLRKR